MKKIIPAACKEDHARVDSHTSAHGGPYAAAGGHALREAAVYAKPTQKQAPGRSCGLWTGAHAGAGFEQKLWHLGGTHTGAVCF